MGAVRHGPGQVVEEGGGEEGGRHPIWCYAQVGSVRGAEFHPRGQAHPHPTTPHLLFLLGTSLSLSLDIQGTQVPFTAGGIGPHPRPSSICPRHLSWQMSLALPPYPSPPPSPRVSISVLVSPEADAWEILAN